MYACMYVCMYVPVHLRARGCSCVRARAPSCMFIQQIQESIVRETEEVKEGRGLSNFIPHAS